MRKVGPWRDLRAVIAGWVRVGLDAHYQGNQSKLAQESGVRRETIWRILKQKTDADPDTLGRLARALRGYPPLHGAQQGAILSAPPLFDPGQWLELVKHMPASTQRQLVAQAFEHGFDRLELHGSGLLRVALAMCTELRRLGYPAIADQITLEIGNAVMTAGAAEAERNERPADLP